MRSKVFFTLLFLSASLLTRAQWEVSMGAGIALPITGYKEVLKSGWLLNGEGKYRFGKGNFATGMKIHYTRLQKDNNPNDEFQNARMTLAPIIFTAEYGSVKGKLQPYVTAGLGLTLFSLNYDVSPTEGKSIFNVSFSMMPQVGLRYAASDNLFPFIESGWILIADGPPVGFPKGSQMTGYNAISAGVSYRFH